MMRKLFCTMVLGFIGLSAFLQTDEKMTQEAIAPNESIALPYASSNDEIAQIKMVAEDGVIQPGKSFWICFQFNISPDWHLYWKNPGEAGEGPDVRWMLPPGFQVKELLWSAPERIEIDSNVIFGYSNRLFLLAQILPPQELEIGSKAELAATINWLGCGNVCVPGQSSFRMSLDVSQTAMPVSKRVKSIFKQARRSLPINTNRLRATIKDDLLELSLTLNNSFVAIQKVVFFPEQRDLLDVKLLPSWELTNDKQTLIVKTSSAIFADPRTTYPFKGVLVIEEEGKFGVKKYAFNVSVDQFSDSKSVKAQTNKNVLKENEQKLANLENRIWYRQLLNDFSAFLRSDLLKVLITAFIGGILLNIMPCVLPVISLKLLHFVELQSSSRLSIAKHGIFYSFGVLLSFWALAGTIIALQSIGKVIGWGFQLQEPIFVVVLTVILFLLGLSLFGVFEFGLSFSSTAGAWDQSFKKRIPTQSSEPSISGSFLSGVLATLVATPCTGPLLGSAIGFAATLEPTASFAIFSALGLGMAFPFLLISFFPALIKILPQPGRWMVTFKQLMGFFMMATVMWLIWVLDGQTQDLSTLRVLLSLFVVAIGAWVYGTWGSFDREKRTRRIADFFALVFVVYGSWILISDVQLSRDKPKQAIERASSQVVGKEWEVFSQPRLERLMQQGIPVFVSVGAKWCLTCQTNHLVLESEKVKEAFIRLGITKMEADWTMNDEAITRYLRSLGRNGVPVYALYGNHHSLSRPLILPEVITQDMVIEALESLRQTAN